MASASTKVVTISILLLIGLVLFVPFNQAVNDNTGVQTVTNESVTVTVGERTDLTGYKVDESTLTVYTDQSGTVLPATNYTVHTEPGELELDNEDTVTNGSTVYATYDYQATSGTTTTILTYGPLLLAVLLLVIAARSVDDLMPG